MDKPTLDALLIDRALGALSAETEALLDAYLEKVPELAAERDQTRTAIDLAREVFHAESPVQLPEFRAPARLHRRRLHRYSLQAAGMAAALAIGFFIGQYHMDSAPGSVPAAMHADLESEPAHEAAGIWSITPDRLRSTPGKASRWKWHSPVQQPQFITQEMRHESF